ncbi:hypothetical protein Pryu01_01083 [Paraliobacillus ryukyuensis]|uniref:Uncharacterized protein YjaZ n=1 Tax=Paraliobacillus ryukyuensis TaxID=200904 RepID=A0A366EFW8_9BACI|nr:DUF2268 domain-containing putative Zn-dependent protease [Paraliobacillus ryukyuensis]RBP00345.1 uncharacterized protein YjaZ [Paraliobacillus ryukyuensis]
MQVADTQAWLQAYMVEKETLVSEGLNIQQATLCQPLVSYFEHASPQDIQIHLIQHGMFHPDPTDRTVIDRIIDQDYWEQTRKQLQDLERIFGKQDGTIFIFPSDTTNPRLQTEFDGVAGLSYHDKLFLFISDQITTLQLKILLTHEYSHVCRLHKVSTSNLTLADGLILEGIAELAVKEIVGEAYCAPWVGLYNQVELKSIWEDWLQPNLTLPPTSWMHHALMYGSDSIPKWAGYAYGFQLVQEFQRQNQVSLQNLVTMPTNDFIQFLHTAKNVH